MKCTRVLMLFFSLTLFYSPCMSAKNDLLVPAAFTGASFALLVATQAKNPLLAAGLSAATS